MLLTPQVQQSFQVAKSFGQNNGPVNSMDYNDTGDLLVTASNDDSINLYDCKAGSHMQTLHSKKYGAALIRFTHGGKTVLHSSLKENHTVRYLSLHDNKYIRYFPGHKDQVTSLSMSPLNDQFLSASRDTSVRLWDVRSQNCNGVLQARAPTTGAFDNAGVVFAVGLGGNAIKLYDARKYENGPFKTFNVGTVGSANTPQFSDLLFSPDGNYIMARRVDGSVILMQSFEGHVSLQVPHRATSCCFSPCGNYTYVGTEDGRILVQRVLDINDSARQPQLNADVTRLQGHSGAISAIAFNPKMLLLASACTELGFWIPTIPQS
eukprot:m.277671 g.277671  ORF g.277671 m.277671 type:complete len:321 (+) comp19785_c0_seq1:304-1266(+)